MECLLPSFRMPWKRPVSETEAVSLISRVNDPARNGQHDRADGPTGDDGHARFDRAPWWGDGEPCEAVCFPESYRVAGSVPGHLPVAEMALMAIMPVAVREHIRPGFALLP